MMPAAPAAETGKGKPAMRPLVFEKIKVSDERYESAGVMDVNNDGIPDIVSGGWWYPGPAFDQKHRIGDVRAEGEYYDDFSTVPMDCNGDGYVDFITGGWWGNTVRWRENPKGDPKKDWPEHVIGTVGNVETTRAWDVDGDGRPEIVPNTPGGPLRVFKLITDAAGKGTGRFSEHVVFDQAQGHGLGFGDITGNGRGDFVLAGGWLEAPEDPLKGKWTWHPDFNLGSASVPILVADVNGDGLADLVVGQSHAYGLDWWEQRLEGGKRTWVKHPIDPANSQYHDLFWVDIDGDGQCEIVTGKRYRAHCGNDPGAHDPVGIYYFKWTGEGFAKQVIDFGPEGRGKGCGIHFQVADLSGNGRLDIVAPGKDGLCVYRNLGFSEKTGH
ncbi:MAG: VCBS repeat-containing protein [Planctomycetes bacterium]|nr:VCBS repeat-containing protein [Planctomycetota bacterium]